MQKTDCKIFEFHNFRVPVDDTPHDDFKLVGDEFPYIVAELAVRMRGQFDLPRVMVLAT